MDNQTYKFHRSTKAGKGRGTHYHVVYLNESKNPKTILISEEKDHGHGGAWMDIQEGLMSQNGSPIPQMPGRWIITPGKDGHTHDIGEEVPASTKIDDEKEEDIVSNVRSLFKEVLELESDYRKRGEESEGFVAGFGTAGTMEGQWEKKLKAKLIGADRAALTINEIEPKLDILSGHQRQNRLDIKFFPVEEGDATVAEILNILTKNILEQNNFNFEETEEFEDGMITGRGNLNLYIDYEKNLDGDIIVEWFPWQQAFYGPHNKKDFSDGEYLFKAQWHSKAFLKNMWPDKADKIQAEYDDIFTEPHRTIKGDQYESSESKTEPVSTLDSNKTDSDFVDLAKKKFRSLECWRKIYKTVSILVNTPDNVFHNSEFWSPKDINAVKTMPGFTAVQVKRHRMRVTKIANTVFLDDDYPKLPVQDFHLLPLYAKKRGNKIWGKVESVKDPQREIDKRHSQGVDILNKVAPYGWFYDSQTFPTPKEQKNFEANSSTPGFSQLVTNVDKPPKQAEGVKFPSELARYEELASAKLKEIMNVNLEMLGMESGAESGIAIIRRQRQGLIGNEFLFDNLSLQKRKLGKMLAAYIQDVYSVERMIRILENRALRGDIIQPQNIQSGSQMENLIKQSEGMSPKYDPAILKELLTNKDLTKYDTIAGESAYSPSNRQGNFILWLEASKSGVPVPPLMLYDLSDLPEKEKAKKMLLEMLQGQKEEADKARLNELIKSGVNPQTGMKEQKPTGGER